MSMQFSTSLTYGHRLPNSNAPLIVKSVTGTCSAFHDKKKAKKGGKTDLRVDAQASVGDSSGFRCSKSFRMGLKIPMPNPYLLQPMT